MRFLAVLVVVSFTTHLWAQTKTDNRLSEAADVFQETMEMGDQSIPEDLLRKAHCAVIIPGMKKGAFVFGAKFGKGFMTCRKEGGKDWTSPGSVRVEGGSIGFQIGGSETDVIMLVMNEKGKDKLLSSKFTLGGDASAAAGPVGRSAAAQTDLQMRAEILTWSRSRGVFAGISLDGATLRQDLDANEDLYGQQWSNRDIVTTTAVKPSQSFERLRTLLNKHSPTEMK